MTADEYAQAACRGTSPSLFFPEQGETITGAVQVCRDRPVRRQCGELGMSEHFGVWGGMSPRARRWVRVARTSA